MTKPLTHQGVSAALRAAGHTRSTPRPSSIRGMREWTEGYKVEKWGEVVRVEWRPASFYIRQTSDEKYAKMHGTYLEVLDKAGFVAHLDDTGFLPRIVVTGRKEKGTS